MTTKALPITFNKAPVLFLLILLGSCHANQDPSDQAVSDPDSKEVLLDVSHKHTVLSDCLQLAASQGLVYYQDSVFTGRSIKKKFDRVVQSVGYLGGKKDGPFLLYFNTGDLSYFCFYRSGRKVGEAKSWWSNGKLRSQSNFVDGVADGRQLQWYKTGQLFKEINLVDGKEEGMQRSWRKNGKIYNNYEAKNGRIFGLKRATLCYQLSDEEVVDSKRKVDLIPSVQP